MQTYRITAPDGTKLKITGESMPSEAEIDQILSSVGKGSKNPGLEAQNPYTVNPGPGLDILKRGLAGVGRSLNPMNLVRAAGDVASSNLEALGRGDMMGLIPGAPMAAQMASRSADRIGEAARLAIDEGDLLGAAGQAGAAVPLVGEMAADMGERAASTGDYAGLAGELAGLAVGPKVGGAVLEGAPRVIRPIAKGLKPMVKTAARMAEKSAPEAVGAAVGGAVGGPWGAAAGAGAGKLLKEAYKDVQAEKAAAVAAKEAAKESAAKAQALAAEKAAAAKAAQAERSAAQKAFEEAKAAKAEAAKAAELEKYRGLTKKEFQMERAQSEALKMDAKKSRAQIAFEKAKADKVAKAKPTAQETFEKAKATKGDVVEAKPAFEGQQSAKGATKDRFQMNRERIAANLFKDGKSEAYVRKLLKTTFKLSDEDIADTLRAVSGKGKN